MRRCFILMPFGDPSLDAHYERVIKPSIENYSYECVRVDHLSTPTFRITSKIIQGIENADVIIANITERNPNVFYELGMAHSFGTNVLVIADKLEKNIPFDIKDFRIFLYDQSKKGDKKLSQYIKNSLSNLGWMNHPNNPIQDNSDRLKHLLNFKPLGFKYYNGHIAEELFSALSTWRSKFPESSHVLQVIAVSGPVAVGKTTFANVLRECIEKHEGGNSVSIIPLDAYMLDRHKLHESNIPNGFDDSNWDLNRAKQDLETLVLEDTPISVRPFNHKTGTHIRNRLNIIPAKYLILDGVVSFHKSFSEFVSFKLFVGGKNIRVEQNPRIQVAYHERNYTLKDAMAKSEREIRDYRSYLLPLRKNADAWLIMKGQTWEYDLVWDYDPFEA